METLHSYTKSQNGTSQAFPWMLCVNEIIARQDEEIRVADVIKYAKFCWCDSSYATDPYCSPNWQHV